MSFKDRNPHLRNEALRREIASVAARLMAEDGIDDFGMAKRKAARQLGCPDTHSMPTNVEVEEEIRAYQAIYLADEQPQILRQLRETALRLMALLNPFNPYLTGPVLNGTAGRFSAIDLELYADNAKDVEIFLLGHGVDYEHARERHTSQLEPPEATLQFEWEGELVTVAVFSHLAERVQRRNPHTGRTPDRARAAAVMALLQADRP